MAAATRAVIAALGALLLAPASALAAVQCAPRPDSPVGYQVTSVGAERVEPPAVTPPIAILDSGVARVPELDGRLRTGLNVTTGSQSTADTDGHGTAVATVAAGAAGGVRGISPSSPVIPIKILDVRGETTADWVIAGIDAAVARGAKVINISAAGPSGPMTSDDRRVLTAIERAVSKGAVVVAPSGNEGASRLDIPASYPHVLAVGATDESNVKASFSNTGAGLDLVAPGDVITSAAPTVVCSTGYSLVSGTSFSAPAVAGAAALLEAAQPALDASQVTDMLRFRAARESAPAWNPDLGFGMLDIPAVLAAPVPRAQPGEVDDDVHWVTKRPLQLSATRPSATIDSSVARHTDPVDVYRVRLRAGGRFSGSVSGGLALSLWSSKTGQFDISAGRKAGLVKRAAGRLSASIRKTGVYYVSVAARAAAPAGVDYTLKISGSGPSTR